jgi:hypothetical protein
VAVLELRQITEPDDRYGSRSRSRIDASRRRSVGSAAAGAARGATSASAPTIATSAGVLLTISVVA